MRYTKAIVPFTENGFMLMFIWKRKKDFLRANGVNGDADACYQNCPRKEYPLQGEFHFIKGKVGVGIVAHEVVHASKAYAKKAGMKGNEEFLCETAQIITRSIWNTILDNAVMNKWVYGEQK